MCSACSKPRICSALVQGRCIFLSAGSCAAQDKPKLQTLHIYAAQRQAHARASFQRPFSNISAATPPFPNWTTSHTIVVPMGRFFSSPQVDRAASALPFFCYSCLARCYRLQPLNDLDGGQRASGRKLPLRVTLIRKVQLKSLSHEGLLPTAF